MVGSEAESTREKQGEREITRKPFHLRLLGVLFGLLVLCDLLVMGIFLGWPVKIAPLAAQAPAMVLQWGNQIRSLFNPGEEAASIPAQTTPGEVPLTPSAQASQTPTPFAAMTFTPTSSPTALPTTTETPTAVPTDTATPEPTATDAPPPVQEQPAPVESPPDSALVEGVTGFYQSLPLSCESRSAVDWARFFGVEINELDFQYALPFTDNPDTGFVGDPRDRAGGIPPYSYGVHAGPVATLLRAYGVPAEDHRWLSYDELRWEIASGRPVIVWVINNVLEGSGVPYTASDGLTTTVAPLEHTVMVVGYTPDVVIIQDGGGRYQVGVDRFLNSWGALENMAVMAD